MGNFRTDVQRFARKLSLVAWGAVPIVALTPVVSAEAPEPQSPKLTVPSVTFSRDTATCSFQWRMIVHNSDTKPIGVKATGQFGTTPAGGFGNENIEPGHTVTKFVPAVLRDWKFPWAGPGMPTFKVQLSARYLTDRTWLAYPELSYQPQFPPKPNAELAIEMTSGGAILKVGVTGVGQMRVPQGDAKVKVCTSAKYPYEWSCQPLAVLAGEIVPSDCGKKLAQTGVTIPPGAAYLQATAFMFGRDAGNEAAGMRIFDLAKLKLPQSRALPTP